MSETEGPSQRDPLARLQVSLDRRSVLLASVVGAQALWFGLVMLRGWYTGPDLGNLSAATGRPLNWDYLTQSMGGHFGPPGRLLFWVLNRTAPLGWGLTVAVRLMLQAAATLLLWRLLERLVGERPWIPLVVALYAVSPLLVPATAVFTNGIGLSIGQVCVLGALLAHVRYTRTGRLLSALVSGALLLLGLGFAEQVALVYLLLPLLSLGFLHMGSLGQRLRQALARWPGWLGLVVSGSLFLAPYIAGSGHNTASGFSLAQAWDITQTEWLHVLGPSLIGGPWRWMIKPNDFVANASPPTVVIALGQLGLFALVVLSARLIGRRALLAWAVPVLMTIGGALLVGAGRHEYLGTFIAPIYRYSYYAAMAMALGVTLAFARTLDEEAAALSAPARPGPPPGRRVPTLLTGAALLAVVAASLGSGLRFAARFWDNPARSYLDTLVASVRAAGPSPNVYDSAVPPEVIPLISGNHYVSDVLGLTDVEVRYMDPSSEPLVASDAGRLGPSTFYSVADTTGPTTPRCGTFVRGAGSTTIPLSPVSTINEWFLQLQLYQPHPNTLTLEVRDDQGKRIPIAGGSSTVHLDGSLAALNRRLGFGRPASLTVRTTDTATNLCLVHTYIGGPLPKAGS